MIIIKKIKDDLTLDVLCEKYKFEKIYNKKNGSLEYLYKRYSKSFTINGSFEIWIDCNNGKIYLENIFYDQCFGYIKNKRKKRVVYRIYEAQELLCELAINGLLEIKDSDK